MPYETVICVVIIDDGTLCLRQRDAARCLAIQLKYDAVIDLRKWQPIKGKAIVRAWLKQDLKGCINVGIVTWTQKSHLRTTGAHGFL